MIFLTEKQRGAMRRLLLKISGWSGARWDQHLRHDVGDEETNAILAWAKRHIEEPAASYPDAIARGEKTLASETGVELAAFAGALVGSVIGPVLRPELERARDRAEQARAKRLKPRKH